MSWLNIILISYFILSISNLVDKIFLSKIVTESVVYAIWVSLLSIGMIVLLVIDVLANQLADHRQTRLGSLSLMSPWFMLVAIFIGIIFTLAIYLLYTSLQKGEASRVIPVIGGSMPVLIYSMTFSYDPLDNSKFVAFVLLVIGTVLISLAPKTNHPEHRMTGNLLALAASFSFALFFVLTQYLFRQQGFLNGLVWPRLGSIIAVGALLSSPHIRKLMAHSLKPLSFRMKTLWLMSQGLGAVGFLGQQYVISIPGVRVALVSALQSFQYVFILIFATLLSFFRPQLLKEYISVRVITQKVLALVCIAIGLYFATL